MNSPALMQKETNQGRFCPEIDSLRQRAMAILCKDRKKSELTKVSPDPLLCLPRIVETQIKEDTVSMDCISGDGKITRIEKKITMENTCSSMNNSSDGRVSKLIIDKGG
jgi:hypothetical protein